MPIFEYTCGTCKKSKDKIVKYEDRHDTRACDYCTGVMYYENKIQQSNFTLKGKGWYKDGY